MASSGTAVMDDRMLFRRYRQCRDAATRDALVERYMPLARRLARVYPAGGELEDLLQVAALALVRAVERYEPDRGFAFSTYATPTILGELKRYFREQGWAVRVPRRLQDRCLEVDRVAEPLAARYGRYPTPGEIAITLGIELEEVLEALAAASVRRSESIERLFPDGSGEVDRSVGAEEDPGFARVETACWLDTLLDVLGQRERRVVELRFREDLTQAEIAGRVGVSQMQVSRLLSRALATLVAEAERDGIAVRPGSAASDRRAGAAAPARAAG